ncbi:PmoA family protein [bacterium]|nr:PmoA family protein [bacterium]
MDKQLKLVEEDLRFKFYFGDSFFLAYNKGHQNYGDFYKSKPDFYPVYSPSGREVTCTCAYRYNHHKSIWIGHARVNGVNFFHDNNPNMENAGEIVLEESSHGTTQKYIEILTTNGWISKKGERILTEERNIRVMPGEEAHIIDLISILIASEGPVIFQQDGHAYIGIRVADSMDAEDGGMIINSNGQVGEEQTMRQVADWVDYSGIVAGQKVGITLMNHPSNPPSAFFTRSYGTFLCNFTLLNSYELPKGESVTQRFRILIHEGDCENVDIAGYFRQFAS